jgi:hypothetical protein
MKKSISLITMLLISILATSQTNFDKGFEDGYKKGYCQDKGNCIAPISPIVPVPNLYESSSSYQDGYNRGFQKGLNDQKTNNSSQNTNSYKTAKGEFVDFSSEKQSVNNNVSVSQEEWLNLGELIKQISESLEFDEIYYEQKIISKEKYLFSREYHKELENLVKYINKNKLTIIRNRNQYNLCLNALNDLNKRVKE